MFGKFKWLYNVAFGFIYLGIGYMLYFKPIGVMQGTDMEGTRKIITVLVILMGLFRIYRGYRDLMAERKG